MLRGTPVQVVVVDWHMPVMDGIEFTERFRAELPGDTYVIMLTARKDDFDFERGYRRASMTTSPRACANPS
jgi:CheY-like chemotaxis protein